MRPCSKIVLDSFIVGCMLSFAIPSIIFGIEEHDNPCQKHTSIKTLSEWLIISGAEQIGFIVLAIFLLAIIFIRESDFFDGLLLLTTIAQIVFKLVWSIVGIIVLAKSSGDCVIDETDLGNMAIAALVGNYVEIMFFCCLLCAFGNQ